MNRKFSTALSLLVAAAGIPAFAQQLNGDLSGGRSTSTEVEQSSSVSVTKEQTSTADRSQDSARTDKSVHESARSVQTGASHNQGDQTTARDAEADRQAKIAANDMSNVDASFRMHMMQARTTFKADDPSEASRHLDQAIAAIHREFSADSKKMDASVSVSERTESTQASSTSQPGDQTRSQYSRESTSRQWVSLRDDNPAERNLRRSLESLEELRNNLSEKKIKSQDDFKTAYANVYRDLALYHYAKAQQDPNAMSLSAEHRDSSASAGAAGVPSSDGSKPLTTSPIDDKTRMHPNNASSAATGRHARHTPNYHAQQAAEYLQVWAKLQDKDLDQKTMTTIRSFETVNITSSDRVEQARLTELGRILDENGIRTETIATERSSSTSSSVDRSGDGSVSESRTQSTQSTTERSSSESGASGSMNNPGSTGSTSGSQR